MPPTLSHRLIRRLVACLQEDKAQSPTRVLRAKRCGIALELAGVLAGPRLVLDGEHMSAAELDDEVERAGLAASLA
jgi:hypothetical protein